MHPTGKYGAAPWPSNRLLPTLLQSQAKLDETLADTIKLVKVLDSVSSPEFAGTFIAAKIQVVQAAGGKGRR